MENKLHPRNLKTTDIFWNLLKKISVKENRSMNAQIIYVLENFFKEYTAEHPDFNTGYSTSADNMTVKEIAMLMTKSNVKPFKIQRKILLVEDSPLEMSIYKEYLENKNCIVDCAPNGAAALDALRKKNDYEFLIIDYQLPDTTADKLYKKMIDLELVYRTIIITSDMRPFIKDSFNKFKKRPEQFIVKSAESLDSLLKSLN